MLLAMARVVLHRREDRTRYRSAVLDLSAAVVGGDPPYCRPDATLLPNGSVRDVDADLLMFGCHGPSVQSSREGSCVSWWRTRMLP